MTVIVTDTGFAPDTLTAGLVPTQILELPSDTDPDTLAAELDQLALITIDFPSFADGRGFTLARLLRLRGYTGRLRARGHVISDQYAMARRAGFDEVEIDSEMATRQPETEWLARADWRAHDYQGRMRRARCA